MLPSPEMAETLLHEAEACNPGPWGNHSRVAAHCARCIAAACGDLNPDKAYICGLLHDIGRKFGVRYLAHVIDGYTYMLSLGYDEVARICLSHSFHNQVLDEYIGKDDVTDEQRRVLEAALRDMVFDDYDRLIQLCDALAGAEGVLDMEVRMADVRSRYGYYPPKKWAKNVYLKQYFEEKAGKDLYLLVEKDTFKPKK